MSDFVFLCGWKSFVFMVLVGWNYIKYSNCHFFTLLTFSNEELWLFEYMNIHEAFHNKL